MIPTLITIAARIGVPEPARKLAAWLGVVVMAALLIAAVIWAWNTWLESVREDAVRVEQIQREAISAKAGETSAEERADAYIQDTISSKGREVVIEKAEAVEAAKPVEARATLSPQDRALNCERLRQAKLTGGPKYKELCQ